MDEILNIRVDSKLKQDIFDYCRENGQTVSGIVRESLKKELEKAKIE